MMPTSSAVNDATRARLAIPASRTARWNRTRPNLVWFTALAGWRRREPSRNHDVPSSTIAAQRSNGNVVATAEARTVAATGPMTQISSCAVVSRANSVRTSSPGTIRG